MESVAALPWNQWQACYGISGSFRVERVAALPWNQWQDSPGIGGSFGVEYATCASVLLGKKNYRMAASLRLDV